MTTWSPQSTCGVKLGLCLPRRMLATIVASRPTTRPSASIRCHFFSTSAGLADLVVFISAFMAGPSRLKRKAAPGRMLRGPLLVDLFADEAKKVKQIRHFAKG